MKKIISLLLAFIVVILLVGCQENQMQSTETSSDATDKISNVLKAGSGEFSEEEIKSAINEYKSNYTNVVLERGGAASVSFETDFEVSSCSVTRLSQTDDTDIEIELHGYIDLFIETNYEGRTVTIPIDWWYQGEDSWVNNCLIWSYLVRVEDVNGNSHYYYFRVDYSAYAQ